jgi:hypothetical protein
MGRAQVRCCEFTSIDALSTCKAVNALWPRCVAPIGVPVLGCADAKAIRLDVRPRLLRRLLVAEPVSSGFG